MKATPPVGAMLRQDLHHYARDMMSQHLGHLLHMEGWTPDDIRFASKAISEILNEELPSVFMSATKAATELFCDDLGHLVAAFWAAPYLALAEHVVRILCCKED